ncbi:hypothetical protein QN277_007841 [Acacia crassicarpa]|uniref:Uncharacterized protein n=1 Tax=Acacia crassicarpa TaxID=499986 RepID=A0AAE1MFS8_9FABA|nr:hypothetical protein QN277_007841 [Acacia crassicarpa]
MADLASYGNSERDIEQALVALKKGSQLLKYNRKGKPKFRPFRLSPDATTLIWISHGREKYIRLSSVSRIIPGQRTAVFRRHLRPEKDYLSFSLVYKNGERTLDLICKDKAEVEIWFGGLKALISPGQHALRSKSNLYDVQVGVDFFPTSRPFGATLEFASTIARGRDSIDSSLNWATSDVASEGPNMQPRTSASDGFRVSVSSSPSCSSIGSGPDDIESLGDVYIWGEVWSDGASPDCLITDVLVPKPLESNVVLDVQQIASGVRHIALVTRQGEVFSWGEESGGRLGHGIEKDFCHPHLIEFLSVQNVEFVACGEYHTCAISTLGDLFTWGDGAHNAGLLGHGSDVSHWIPKRVTGPLEGLQVVSIACGTWHSALATSNGKLFTFGDGTFGVLGHGDRSSVSYPREVQSLSGLKTIKVACGVWHTAAIIEVMGHQGTNVSSRKLFTWGDGDKYRLGHGNKETYLQPTCVSALIEHNFLQIACGHNMTVALDTSGCVVTMGGTAYGQLGNALSDGKTPTKVQDKLVGEYVEEISCGANHVAVLTSRSELYTWGKGANGRLGHGDTHDRKSPTLVESLKDRHIRNVSCGSNFTSCICIHKWISGPDQSVCCGCRQAFGFTRKRHNCYNCGLVHCHACSSKKALRAALAPTPGKPHRVCDACYNKLKAAETASASFTFSRKPTPPRQSIDGRERLDRGEARSSRILVSSIAEPVKFLEIWGNKPESKHDFSSLTRSPQSSSQFKHAAFPSSLKPIHNAFRSSSPPPTPPANSRPASPYTRRPSPPRSASPGFSRSMIENLSKSNEHMNQELSKLQNQIRSLKQKNDKQDMEIQKLKKNVQEATLLTGEESSKHRLAREFIKSMTDQLKDVTENLPPDNPNSEILRNIHAQAEDFLRENLECEASSSILSNTESSQEIGLDTPASDIDGSKLQEQKLEETTDPAEVEPSQHLGNSLQESSRSSLSIMGAATPQQSLENGSKSPDSMQLGTETEQQVVEQFESGVYVTLVVKPNGSKVFKRVRFSKRRFHAQQAEEWWNTNKDRLFKTYSSPTTNLAATGSSATSNTNP